MPGVPNAARQSSGPPGLWQPLPPGWQRLRVQRRLPLIGEGPLRRAAQPRPSIGPLGLGGFPCPAAIPGFYPGLGSVAPLGLRMRLPRAAPQPRSGDPWLDA
jgi:hypothetical protein